MFEDEKVTAYEEALKRGKASYAENVSKGLSGNLPSLDVILRNADIVSDVPLGLMEIPIRKIRGTYTNSRATLLAPNFMPLAPVKSEFASKWRSVYVYHVRDGLRDPITAFEYLNWFYVVEGNKRVSVVSYLDAVSISGEVRRYIPRYNEDDKTIRTYYEFLKFNKETGLFNIYFSDENDFSRMLTLLRGYKAPDWITGSKYEYFVSSVYNPFRELFERVGGLKHHITTADALLEYIEIYGIPERIIDDEESRERMHKFMEEIHALEDRRQVSVRSETLDTKKKLFSISTLIMPKKRVRAAFVYAQNKETSGWTYAHDLGRSHVEHLFGDALEARIVEGVPETSEAYNVFKDLAEEGYDLIFATRPTFIRPALKAALEYPEVKFLACTAVHLFKNVITYTGRIFEPRFLMGVIAGSLTRTDVIGYMAEYPISEVITGVNAFTIGARMVNPRVTVKVAWSYKWDKDGRSVNPEAPLYEQGADLISHDGLPIPGVQKKYGLFAANPQTGELMRDVHYAMPIWHWGIFYEKIIQAFLNGSWDAVVETLSGGSDLLHYWWGIDSGLVDIFYSTTHVPRETQRLIEFLRQSIIDKEFFPFTGPIPDQNGVNRIPDDHIATHEEMIEMDYFVEGVEGDIPLLERDERSDDPLTDLLGIRK